jgi:hypothetical protein
MDIRLVNTSALKGYDKNPRIMNYLKSQIKTFGSILLVAVILITIPNSLKAQEVEEFDFNFNFKTIKNADYTRTLNVEFYGELDRDVFPVYGAEINFYNLYDEDSLLLLGTTLTTDEGIATLILPENQKYIKDEDGYITFRAIFEETESLESFEEELSVLDLVMSFELNEDEGENSIDVYASVINASGEKEPVEETDIYFYVKGMVNPLPIYDDWLEEGEYTFDFPDNLPGDLEGNLIVYIKIEDSDDFGNVVQEAQVPWGIGPMTHPVKTRKLWTEGGPEWMIAVLSILLILVWSNIFHAIFHLIRVRKEGRQFQDPIRKI